MDSSESSGEEILPAAESGAGLNVPCGPTEGEKQDHVYRSLPGGFRV